MSALNRTMAAATTLVLLLPGFSRAATPEFATNGCVRALLADLAESFHPAPRLSEAVVNDDESGSDALRNPAEWYLTATNPRTNLPVERVRCVTDAEGQVVEFHKVPL